MRDSSHLYFPDRKTSAIFSNIENNALDLAIAASQRGQTLATPIFLIALLILPNVFRFIALATTPTAWLGILAGLTTAVAVYYSSREIAL